MTGDYPDAETKPGSGRTVDVLIVVGLILVLLPFYMRNLDRPLGNGDEAVYAELARGMARGGDWLTARWQERPVFNRPPASIWPLALAMKVAGTSEAVIYAVGAVEAVVVVVLVYVLGMLLWSRSVGLLAALFAGTTTLHLIYARTVVADNLLCIFVLTSFIAWEMGRKRRAWLIVWGLVLGFALLTKQVVGLLPLAAPIADGLARRPVDWRKLAASLAIGLALAGLWLGIETWRFGPVFLRQHLLLNVVLRARAPMLEQTTASFYLRMLVALETPLIVLSALGMLRLLVRHRFLVPLWGLGSLFVFSVSATRFNYYALTTYPALALAMAALLQGAWQTVPGRSLLRVLRLALPWLALGVWLAVHLPMPGFLRAQPSMDPEPGWLARTMGQVSAPGDPLFLVGINPYSPRFYSDRHTVQLVARASSTAVSTAVLEAERWPVDDVAATLHQQPRWFAILRKDQIAMLHGLENVRMVNQTPSLVLVSNQDHSYQDRTP